MKKIILLLLISFVSNFIFATDRYFSASGNDVTGTGAIGRPYKTIAKLNSILSGLVPGSNIYFNRGDTFYGTIYVTSSGTSGNPITFTAYGTGARPIITGFVTLTGWTNVSGSIYQASVMATNRLNMVTLNGVPQQVARFPNAGYLTYSAYSDSNSFTQAGLNGYNFTGGEVVSKKNGFLVDRQIITGHSSSTITCRQIATLNPRQSAWKLASKKASGLTPSKAGFGLYIQRLPSLIDSLGEWYYDTTANTLQMDFGAGGTPSGTIVKVATLDTLININNKSYINIDNIDFEGANLAAIYYQDNQNINITNFEINYSGAKGIFGWNASNVYISNGTITKCWANAVDHTARQKSNTSFVNCTVTDIGLAAGMAYWGDNNDFQTVYISVDSFARICLNSITNVGYEGVSFAGSKVNCDSNYIDNFCFVKDDGGAIYTYGNGSSLSYGRTIRHNIIRNGLGSTAGNANGTHAEGIYSDGGLPTNAASGAAGIIITDNYVENVYGRAYYNNDPKNITLRNNTSYNSMAFALSKHYQDSIMNYSNTQNIYFKTIFASSPPANNQIFFNEGLNSTKPPVVSTIQQSLQKLGTIDSNYWQFDTPNTTPFLWYYCTTYGGGSTFASPVNFATWQSYTGNDAHSTLFTNSTVGTQLHIYSTFSPTTVTFTGSRKKDIFGTIYDNSATVPAWNSLILIDYGTVPESTLIMSKNKKYLR